MHFGHFGLIKVLVVSISFALAICFVGCGDDSSSGPANDTRIEADAEDVSSSSKDDEGEEISSSSKSDEDEEITDGDEADEEEVDEEEAESSSSSKKSGKSSSSGKKKSKSSSSKSKSSDDEEPEEPENPEEPGENPGVEPAKPASSPSSEGEYPDLSVLSNPNLEQGCDIDKDADVWVIPSQFMEAEKTVYIWKGDMYSVSSVVELPLGSLMFCEMALGKADSTLSSDEAGENLDIQKTCDDNGVMRTWSSNPFQKADRDAVYENATILCRDDLFN